MSFWRFLLLGCFVLSASQAHRTADSTEVPLVVSDPVIVRGLEWLLGNRQPDFGFKDLTPRVVIALQMANTSSWFTPHNLESLLTVKQMDLELVLQIFRHSETPISPADLAMYSIALTTICRDPRQFYSHDLIGNLNHHEMLLDTEFALSALAVCASGTHVRKRQMRRLLDITDSHDSIDIETLSMVIIALNCIVHDHRNRNLQHYLVSPTKQLGGRQKEDGSFGSLTETAMAIQALQATDPGGRHWNRTSAVKFVVASQNEDGSFGPKSFLRQDISTTASILVAIGPRGWMNVKDFNCHPDKGNDWSNRAIIDIPVPLNFTFAEVKKNLTPKEQDTNKSVEATSKNESEYSGLRKSQPTREDKEELAALATVSYTLWVGTNVTETYTVNITTEVNNTFYNVMQMAAQMNEHFSFSSTEWPNGHYVHTLAGHKEEPMSYHYWLLYRLSTPPSIGSPPPNQFVAPVGVDELLVENDDHYLFWYKKL